LGLEDSQSVAQFYGLKQLLHNEIESPDSVVKKLRAVTIEDIQALVKKLVKPGELRFGLIGEFDQDKIKKIISKY